MAVSGFIFRVAKLAEIFFLWEELINAAMTWASAVKSARSILLDAVTRTDAMASAHGIFVAGWSASCAAALARREFSWLAFELGPNFFPDVKSTPRQDDFGCRGGCGDACHSGFRWGARAIRLDGDCHV